MNFVAGLVQDSLPVVADAVGAGYTHVRQSSYSLHALLATCVDRDAVEDVVDLGTA